MTFANFHFDEPDWRPLESILELEHCAGFMYMGVLELDGQRLHHYKHVISRRYLFVTDELKTYRYLGEGIYVPQPRKKAIRHAVHEPR